MNICIGLLAGILTTSSLIPQAFKIWRSKSAEDLSLATFITMCAGVLLWLVYGFILNDIALIVTNAFSLIVSGTILCLKIRYTRAVVSKGR